jgi:hypothetical protein
MLKSKSWSVAWLDSMGALTTNNRSVDPIRRSIQNIATRRGPLKLGLDEESNRAGWGHN